MVFELRRVSFGKGLRCRPAVYKCPEDGHCTPSRGLVEECYSDKELPWVVCDTFLYEDRFGIEKTFVKVERCEEEHCVTRRIGQESDVVLLVLGIMGR